MNLTNQVVFLAVIIFTWPIYSVFKTYLGSKNQTRYLIKECNGDQTPLTPLFRDSTLSFWALLRRISPLESFKSFSLFSTLSIFKFLTQTTFSRPLVYCALSNGWPDFLDIWNWMWGYFRLSSSSLLETRKSRIPWDEPPQLQYCSVIFLHGNTNAPTPFRAIEFCFIAFTTISHNLTGPNYQYSVPLDNSLSPEIQDGRWVRWNANSSFSC